MRRREFLVDFLIVFILVLSGRALINYPNYHLIIVIIEEILLILLFDYKYNP